MKVLISYVLQNDCCHTHESEIIELESPPVSYSSETPVEAVMEWTAKKQKELSAERKLIILNMFNLS